MSKKILVVSRHFWPEDNRINELCEKLTERGFRVSVLCGQPSGENGDFVRGYNSFKIRRESRSRIDIHRSMDVRKGNGSNISVFMNYAAFPLFSYGCLKKLSEGRYEAIIIYQESPVWVGMAAFRLGKKLNIPVYMYVADLWPYTFYGRMDIQSGVLRKLLALVSRKIYEKPDKLIVQSERTRKLMAGTLLWGYDRLPVVPVWPDPAYMTEEPDVDLLEKTAGSFNCLVFGDFNGQLAADYIVNAADKLRQEGIRHIRFVITGKSEMTDDMQKTVMSRNLNDYFFFEGYIPPEKTGSYIHIADAVLCAVKLRNGIEYDIPAGVIDIIAAGRPVAVTLSGPVKELVKTAGCGYTSETDDEEAFYANLLKLYRLSPEERKLMGENGRRYCLENFSCDHCADRICEIMTGSGPDGVDSGIDADEGSIRKLWE
ncbi:MAG: glycosyltransferase family 4 protein [Parasporobacterium sp.]|nr:glycosyltransferase family 4 protein [Parasporobacterium sp.]